MNIDIQISSEALSVEVAMQSVADDSCGGNALFIGSVRNINKGETVTHLFFDTYDEMAIKELKKIAGECLERFEVKKIAIYHRKGEVIIGDLAVVIAVSSMHRDGAFKACRYAIDELKKNVPIWKKEFLVDGSHWIDARP